MPKQDTSTTQEVKAHARYIHVSPRKLRLLADLIRRERVDVALEQLRFSPKKAALPLTKVVHSAIANAVHNFNLPKETLYIKSITVDGGPVVKRYVPRAQGRAFIERKRTSHINVVLEALAKPSKPPKRSFFQLRKSKAETAPVIAEAEKEPVEKIVVKKQRPKQAPKSAGKIKRHLVDLKRRLFNRRGGE